MDYTLYKLDPASLFKYIHSLRCLSSIFVKMEYIALKISSHKKVSIYCDIKLYNNMISLAIIFRTCIS